MRILVFFLGLTHLRPAAVIPPSSFPKSEASDCLKTVYTDARMWIPCSSHVRPLVASVLCVT